MADQKISALSAVTAPASTDVVPIVNAATTKKVAISDLVKAGNVAIWARVFHNAAQSITSGVPTTLAFNSERADTDTIHDNVTNNSRLTCKTAGVYSISASIDFASNATGYRRLLLFLNGTTFIAVNGTPAVNGIVTEMAINIIQALAVNDYVEVVVVQSSGGALNVDSTAQLTPEFMMARIGA